MDFVRQCCNFQVFYIMKEWADKIDAGGKFGICTVREHTDEEVNAAREQGLNYAHCDGFVNLFHGEKFVGWCGTAWAEKRIVRQGSLL